METSFRYKGAAALCLWTCAVDLLAVIIIVASAWLGGAAGVLAGSVMLVLFSVIGACLIVYLADVVVTDRGLSRRLWGRTIAEIVWDNVKVIRVAQGFDPDPRKRVRVFSVYPAKPPVHRLSVSGKIWFAEHGDLSALLEHMNHHIVAYGIPVEVKVGERWSSRDRVDPLS